MKIYLKTALIVLCLVLTSCQPLLTTDAIKGREDEVVATSELFLTALFSKDIDQTLALSKMPFFLDARAILGSTGEWKSVLSQLFEQREQAKMDIVSVKVMTPLDVQAWNMTVWSQLIRYGFDKQGYVLADLNIQPKTGTLLQEKVLLIMHYTDDGRWRVCGFLRPPPTNVIE